MQATIYYPSDRNRPTVNNEPFFNFYNATKVIQQVRKIRKIGMEEERITGLLFDQSIHGVLRNGSEISVCEETEKRKQFYVQIVLRFLYFLGIVI